MINVLIPFCRLLKRNELAKYSSERLIIGKRMHRNEYISNEWKLNIKGHINFDFVDVAINSDNKLFIDPCLIEMAGTEWAQKSMSKISSFMNELVESYSNKDEEKKIALLMHAREQNATKFGYGNGFNGKGNTVDGLLDDFQPLEELVKAIKSVNQLQDITVLLPGFAEDGLSDLLTNILHLELSEFTDNQMKKYGIESNREVRFTYWNNDDLIWKTIIKPGYEVNGKEFLIVPKNIVRKKYLFSTGQYFSRVILERIRDEYTNADGKKIAKKDVVKAKRFSGDHWIYKETIRFTIENDDALTEYHDKMIGYYVENGGAMTDEELDFTVYGECVKMTA